MRQEAHGCLPIVVARQQVAGNCLLGSVVTGAWLDFPHPQPTANQWGNLVGLASIRRPTATCHRYRRCQVSFEARIAVTLAPEQVTKSKIAIERLKWDPRVVLVINYPFSPW